MRSFSQILPRALGAAAVAVSLLAGSSNAEAAIIRFTSVLGPEVSGATGSGVVDVFYDDVAKTLRLSTTFSGLSGVTTVAHIHCCTTTPGASTVGVAVTPGTLPGFPTGLTSGNYTTVLDLTQTATYTGGINGFLTRAGGTTALAEQVLVQGMRNGTAYFNVHTNRFPGGEVRGFLAVPEPGTLVLIGTALAGLAIRRRRE